MLPVTKTVLGVEEGIGALCQVVNPPMIRQKGKKSVKEGASISACPNTGLRRRGTARYAYGAPVVSSGSARLSGAGPALEEGAATGAEASSGCTRLSGAEPAADAGGATGAG
jgi:hypothetical protein